jgi:hypothetical protein
MGDRANCIVRQYGSEDDEGEGEPQEIYLYTHDLGSLLPRLVQSALRRQQYWDDPSYLTRIIFCTMLNSDSPNSLNSALGFGIGLRPGDNSHDYVVVDVPAQEVRLENESRVPKMRWSFEEFCIAKLS